MGYRFFRRIRLAPGITLNLTKLGASISAGPRGAKLTAGTSGIRRTFGIPGTGLFYTQQTSLRGRPASTSSRRSLPAAPDPKERLTLGFFKKLLTPKDEQELVAGLAALVQGDERDALRQFKQATHLVDAAFLAGLLYLKTGKPKNALPVLQLAAKRKARLGHYLLKYGIELGIRMSITPQVAVEINADKKGLLLALVEALQELNQLNAAVQHLAELRRLAPDDPVVTLSLVELLMEARPRDKRIAKKVLEWTQGVQNETEVHAGLLLFRAKALRMLGMDSAARTLLSKTLRKRKNRSAALLQALRYERAAAYERLGQKARARADLELIYAEDPDYEDVAARLGIH